MPMQYRFLRGMLYQLWRQPQPQTPRHLFDPLVISGRNTLLDCDYNIHKSNSTYFTDLDIALGHAVGIVLRTGLERLNRDDQQGVPAELVKAPGQYNFALGGVSCFFHRQIEPLQAYDICTRLLTWDQKWIYFVSHFVRKGVIQPESYSMQPWKKSKAHSSRNDIEKTDLKPHIFATSIARFVGKKGRLTMTPDALLTYSRLIPPRVERGDESINGSLPALNGSVGAADEHPTEAKKDEWKWEDMDRERLRGLGLAKHFDALGGGLQSEISIDEVLGEFGTYW